MCEYKETYQNDGSSPRVPATAAYMISSLSYSIQ